MCQKSRQKDKMGIIEMLNEYKTKGNSLLLQRKKKQKPAVACDPDFRERGSDFSLDFPSFG